MNVGREFNEVHSGVKPVVQVTVLRLREDIVAPLGMV